MLGQRPCAPEDEAVGRRGRPKAATVARPDKAISLSQAKQWAVGVTLGVAVGASLASLIPAVGVLYAAMTVLLIFCMFAFDHLLS